jgi:hypothetical protein
MEPINHSDIGIETLPAMRVGRRRAISLDPENDASGFIRAWLEKRELVRSTTRTFGFDVDILAEDSQAGKRGYEIWATVPEGTPPGDGVTLETYQGGLYATLTLYKPFDDPFSQIPNGWKLLHRWVIGSERYQGGQHQWLEEKICHADGDDLKLYYPVIPKKVPSLVRLGQV